MTRGSFPIVCLPLVACFLGATRVEPQSIAEFDQPCDGPAVCGFHLEIVNRFGLVVTESEVPADGCGHQVVDITALIPESVPPETEPLRLKVWSVSCDGVRSVGASEDPAKGCDWVFIDLSSRCRGTTGSSIPGDSNGDEEVDISDAISLLAYLFTGGPFPCGDADYNQDADLDTSDPIGILTMLFEGGDA